MTSIKTIIMEHFLKENFIHCFFLLPPDNKNIPMYIRLISEHFATILTYVPLILIFIHLFNFIFFGIPNV